ncbi:cob(I)yrinic acid a,c-diamide adenosyltransferase [Proteinivorax tanatarense]|uniref:Cob(I)yrinic acid a,c-diamide adenosyltransferase n=1 Tax=Proteinivorax tanatarense TaxID=1260629 RepID=A0AAU7VJ39_9FIRM
MEKGYIQIYTGEGKGKTTAALGLAFRAAGRGFHVTFVQFLKGMYTGEEESIKRFENIRLYRLAEAKKLFWNLTELEQEDLKKQTQKEWAEFVEYIKKQNCDVLILDEIMGALKNELLSEEQVCDFLDNKPESLEIILTGRNVPAAIKERGDLITEMNKIRHYYDSGVTSREGIEK